MTKMVNNKPEISRDIREKITKWAENDYLLQSGGPLAVPSAAEMLKYANSNGYNVTLENMKKLRNSLEVVSKYKVIGNTFRKRNLGFSPSFVPRSGWVHIDVGFIGKNKKQYGQFILAVDSLTQRVKIKTFKKQAKSKKNLQKFIIELMEDDQWKSTYRVVTDGESGMSINAIRFLESRYPELRIIKLDYNINTKAFLSERKIRSFKSKLSRYCLINKIPLARWRVKHPVLGKIPALVVQNALNNTKIVDDYTPNKITQANEKEFMATLIQKKKKYAYTFLYGISVPKDSNILNKIFKFKEGDKVLVALTEHPDAAVRKKQWKKKSSIVGHFDKNTGIFEIVWRTFTISAKLYLTFHYRIKREGDRQSPLPRLYHEDYLRLYLP